VTFRYRTVFLDAGGVIVLPHRGLVSAALAKRGIRIDASTVPHAHYAAVRRLDRTADDSGAPNGWVEAFCESLDLPPGRLVDAVTALSDLADRTRSGEILWSEPTPHVRSVIDGLTRAGMTVVVVTNSDGHAAENLRDAAICQTAEGSGARVADIVDSKVVGSAKPDPGIFMTALARAHAEPASTVHVGDMVANDVAGAQKVGITPIHFDPYRRCRASDHRHMRSLAGIWRHVGTRPTYRHTRGL
jgi:putative hydrolase of the HAD superfamily